MGAVDVREAVSRDNFAITTTYITQVHTAPWAQYSGRLNVKKGFCITKCMQIVAGKLSKTVHRIVAIIIITCFCKANLCGKQLKNSLPSQNYGWWWWCQVWQHFHKVFSSSMFVSPSMQKPFDCRGDVLLGREGSRSALVPPDGLDYNVHAPDFSQEPGLIWFVNNWDILWL